MTLLERLADCNRRIKYLTDQNRQLRLSRDKWRARSTDYRWENQELRRSALRLKASRDRWKSGQRPRSRPVEWKNIHLSAGDLERIMEMKPR